MYEAYLKAVAQYWELWLSIDRIDNDGNYYKENCIFIPKNENSRKTRRTYEIDIDWETLSWVEASKKLWINENTIRGRKMRGLDMTHIGKIPHPETIMPYYNKHKQLFGDKAKPYIDIYHRIKKKWRDIERAINTP